MKNELNDAHTPETAVQNELNDAHTHTPETAVQKVMNEAHSPHAHANEGQEEVFWRCRNQSRARATAADRLDRGTQGSFHLSNDCL